MGLNMFNLNIPKISLCGLLVQPQCHTKCGPPSVCCESNDVVFIARFIVIDYEGIIDQVVACIINLQLQF